jgi:hypothetical protein
MMRAEVVSAVRELVREGRKGFRASYVAERAQVALADAQRDLVALAQVGDLQMNFEVMAPDGRTVAVFHERDRIPDTMVDDEAEDEAQAEFRVTPRNIWVTFSPTKDLLDQLASESAAVAVDDVGGGQPGNCSSPRRARATRATGLRTFWTPTALRSASRSSAATSRSTSASSTS